MIEPSSNAEETAAKKWKSIAQARAIAGIRQLTCMKKEMKAVGAHLGKKSTYSVAWKMQLLHQSKSLRQVNISAAHPKSGISLTSALKAIISVDFS